MRYFGYGSNLNEEDRNRWAAQSGWGPFRLDPLAPAYLPDHELVYHYRSPNRGGGALNVRPRIGSAVFGVVFEADEHAWQALDAKEGAPTRYTRHRVRVLLADGAEMQVTTYQVQPEFQLAKLLPPTEAYRRAVDGGLKHFALPLQGHDDARSSTREAFPSLFFAYGTLKRDHCRHDLLARFVEGAGTEAIVEGSMLDLGEYPGLVAEPKSVVHGELYRLRDPEAAFSVLDPVEDFEGYGRSDSMYRRIVCQVRDARGGSRWAWTYLLVRIPFDAKPIAGGRW